MELKMKLVSALEKVFLDEEPVEKPEAGRIEGFQNETISFQAAFSLVSPDARVWVWPKIVSPLADYIRVRTDILHHPNKTCGRAHHTYLRDTPIHDRRKGV